MHPPAFGVLLGEGGPVWQALPTSFTGYDMGGAVGVLKPKFDVCGSRPSLVGHFRCSSWPSTTQTTSPWVGCRAPSPSAHRSSTRPPGVTSISRSGHHRERRPLSTIDLQTPSRRAATAQASSTTTAFDTGGAYGRMQVRSMVTAAERHRTAVAGCREPREQDWVRKGIRFRDSSTFDCHRDWRCRRPFLYRRTPSPYQKAARARICWITSVLAEA